MELYRSILLKEPKSMIELPELKPALEVVQDVFQVDDFGALLLCPLISGRLLGETRIDKSELFAVIGKDYASALKMTRYLERYLMEGLLSRGGMHFRFSDGVGLSEKAYRAIMLNRRFESKRRENLKSFAGFLETFAEIVDIHEDDDERLDLIYDELDKLSDTYEHLPEMKFLAWLKLDRQDMFIILQCCSKYYFERENNYNVEAIVDSMGCSRRRSLQLNNELREGVSGLIKNDLLKFHSTAYKSIRNMQLTDRAIEKLGGSVLIDNHIKPLRRGKLLLPDELGRQKLYYNPSERDELQRIAKLISSDAFIGFRERAGRLGMTPGVTVLLFVKPGTGKTSTVYEMAVQSGRKVY